MAEKEAGRNTSEERERIVGKLTKICVHLLELSVVTSLPVPLQVLWVSTLVSHSCILFRSLQEWEVVPVSAP